MNLFMQTILIFLLSGQVLVDKHPFINYNTHSLQPGDTLIYHMIEPFTIIGTGQEGANVNWDFSDIQFLEEDNILITIHEVPITNLLRDKANIIMRINKNEAINDFYYLLNSQSMSLTATGWQSKFADNLNEYNNALLEMIYPVYYGNQFDDSYGYTIDFNEGGEKVSMEIEGMVTVKADAFGSLDCKYGFHENVLRIKISSTEMIKTYMNDEMINASQYLTNSYRWYDENRRYCLMEINQDSNGDLSGKLLMETP